MEISFESKLDDLPDVIYYDGQEYLLNISIHNDGVNIDYCDGEDELFGLGVSYNEEHGCKSEILNAIVEKAIIIINEQLWERDNLPYDLEEMFRRVIDNANANPNMTINELKNNYDTNE